MKPNKKEVYVVTLYRWGDRECHSYVTWAGRSKSAALKAADAEEEYRGGKYNAEVLEFGEDGRERRVIVPLKRHPDFCKSSALQSANASRTAFEG